jgi:serine/threonine protein kinase
MNRFFKQILSAISYLHKSGVIHGDIKPANIMVDDKGDFFLTDFSTSSHFEWKNNWPVSSPLYCPIEGYDKKVYNKWDEKVDSWSFGCTIYKFLTSITGNTHNLFHKQNSVFDIVNSYLDWHKFLCRQKLSSGKVKTSFHKRGSYQNRSVVARRRRKSLFKDSFAFVKKFKDNTFYPIICALLQVDPVERLRIVNLYENISLSEEIEKIKPKIFLNIDHSEKNKINKFINRKMSDRNYFSVNKIPGLIAIEKKVIYRLKLVDLKST